MITSDKASLFPTVFSYYEREKDHIFVGSYYYSNHAFNWIAIGV